MTGVLYFTMSKHKIRYNKTCLNCGAFVDRNHCPKCGQENSESRQSFHHLFTHFVFDLFHYDNAFWRTIKYLFASPARLSLEYMSGKRKSYVNPFSLYIFISFLAFFIPSVLPEATKSEMSKEEVTMSIDTITANKELRDGLKEISNIPKTVVNSVSKDASEVKKSDSKTEAVIHNIIENLKDKQKKDQAIEFFIHNIPKVLFIYMPIFAFWLWLFNNKKKRYYFDSGIFTLHFFSVLLLSITICIVLSNIFTWLEWDTTTDPLIWTALFLYITFYFFRGCRNFYGDKRWIANLKSLILIHINGFMILLIFILYLIFIVYKYYM